MATLKHLLQGILRWLARRLARRIPPSDPWVREVLPVPVGQFGRGSVKEFAWYFEGASAVSCATVDDICLWLLGCSYARDPDLFHEEDFWQHPATFERLRQGDCEDHAIWAWRKLVELGIDAELMSGTQVGVREETNPPRGHVWVRYRVDGEDYLMESVAKSLGRMIRPLAEVRSGYVPHCGVDRNFQTYSYAGTYSSR